MKTSLRPIVLLIMVVPLLNAATLQPLRVSENHRFLVTADGRPFFWLGDTAWELFHRLNREEATRYLEDRASKGFTVIQAVALAELDGLNTPNAYCALFSGAFGHTYGCNEVWQMWAPGREPLIGADRPWHEALSLPGAGQTRHARALIESGPYFDRLPDTSLVVPPNSTGPDYVAACRAPDARYALIYFPSGISGGPLPSRDHPA